MSDPMTDLLRAAAPPPAAAHATGPHPLATPFDLRPAVDVLLDDLGAPPRLNDVVPPAASSAERRVHRAAVAAQRNGGGRAVLVVDPSAIARKFLMQRLEGLGYHARGAESGEQALAMIEREDFAIVFLEFVLGPRHAIDGLGVCQALKHRREQPQARVPAVVMVTGQAGPSDRVRGSLAGCDAYLTKPLVETAFVAALANVDPQFR